MMKHPPCSGLQGLFLGDLIGIACAGKADTKTAQSGGEPEGLCSTGSDPAGTAGGF